MFQYLYKRRLKRLFAGTMSARDLESMITDIELSEKEARHVWLRGLVPLWIWPMSAAELQTMQRVETMIASALDENRTDAN